MYYYCLIYHISLQTNNISSTYIYIQSNQYLIVIYMGVFIENKYSMMIPM